MSPPNCQNGLFIFRRDFRIKDNVGLIEACKRSKNLYTCFIFTPEQVSDQNAYRSQNAIQFMIESLVELQKIIHDAGGTLITMYGSNDATVQYLVDELNIDCVYFNKDYTPYAVERDNQVLQLCEKKKIR
jgi:deoxyribodipyrimidine photo-lyase